MHGLALSVKNRTPDMETLAREFTAKPVMEVERTVAAGNSVRQTEPTDIQRKEAEEDPSQPSFKKSKKPLLLVAALVALVAIGGGIFAGVAIFGSKNTEVPVVEYSIADTGSTAAPQTDSAVPATTSQTSALMETTSKTEMNYHTLYDGSIVDDRLDTADVSAELVLRNHTGDLTTEVPLDNVSVSVEAVGNALVAEYRFLSEPTDDERESAQKEAEQLKTSAQSDLQNLRTQSGNSNAQLVYVFLDQNGGVIAGTLVG